MRGPGFYYYHAHCHGLRFGIAKTSLILVGAVAEEGHATFRVLDASEILSPEERCSGCEGELSEPPG
jgi:hypothetical protein